MQAFMEQLRAGKQNKLLIKFALWGLAFGLITMATSFSQQLFVNNSYYYASIQQLTAVSTLFSHLALFISVGGSILFSIQLARQQRELAMKVLFNTSLLLLVYLLVSSLIIILGTESIFHQLAAFMGMADEQDTINYAALNLVTFIFMVSSIFSHLVCFLIAMAKPRQVVLYAAIAVGISIICAILYHSFELQIENMEYATALDKLIFIALLLFIYRQALGKLIKALPKFDARLVLKILLLGLLPGILVITEVVQQLLTMPSLGLMLASLSSKSATIFLVSKSIFATSTVLFLFFTPWLRPIFAFLRELGSPQQALQFIIKWLFNAYILLIILVIGFGIGFAWLFMPIPLKQFFAINNYWLMYSIFSTIASAFIALVVLYFQATVNFRQMILLISVTAIIQGGGIYFYRGLPYFEAVKIIAISDVITAIICFAFVIKEMKPAVSFNGDPLVN